MDPYFHHYRRPNTYIPLPPQYNHHHLRQVPNHVLVNPTAFNFNPPVFLPANPLFVPQVPVLFEHDSRHRSSMLSQSPSNSNPSRSASRFSNECFGGANRRCRVVVPPNSGIESKLCSEEARDSSLETTALELDRYDYDRVDKVHEYTGIPKKQVKRKSAFLRIQAPKPSNGENEDDEQLHCDDCAVVDSKPCSSSSRIEDKHCLNDGKQAEVGEEIPFGVDVFFESNSMVAKAIVGSSSSSFVSNPGTTAVSNTAFSNPGTTAVSNTALSPIGKTKKKKKKAKKRKCLVSEISCSDAHRVSELPASAAQSNSSQHLANDISISGKDLTAQKDVSLVSEISCLGTHQVELPADGSVNSHSSQCLANGTSSSGEDLIAQTNASLVSKSGCSDSQLVKLSEVNSMVAKAIVVPSNSTIASNAETTAVLKTDLNPNQKGKKAKRKSKKRKQLVSESCCYESKRIKLTEGAANSNSSHCLSYNTSCSGKDLTSQKSVALGLQQAEQFAGSGNSHSSQCLANGTSNSSKDLITEVNVSLFSKDSCSESQLVKLSEFAVISNSSQCLVNGTSNSGKDLRPKKNVSDCFSHLHPSPVQNPNGKTKVAQSSKGIVTEEVANTISGKATPRVVKKKKIVKRVVKKVVKPKSSRSSSISANMFDGIVKEDNVPVSSLTAAAPLDKIPTTSFEEKTAPVDKMSVPDYFQSLPSEGNLLLEDKNAVVHLEEKHTELFNGNTSDINHIEAYSKQSCQHEKENCDIQSVPNSDISIDCVKGDTGTVEEREVRTLLKFSPSKMEGMSLDAENPVGLANVVDTTSDLLKGPSLSEALDISVPMLDFGSQSRTDGITTLTVKRGISVADLYEDANKISPLYKRRRTTACHSSITECPSELSDVIVASTTSCAEVPIHFSDMQIHKEEVELLSMAVMSTPLLTYTEDIAKLSDISLGRDSFESMNLNRERDSPKSLELQHSGIASNSLLEYSATPNVHFPMLEGRKINLQDVGENHQKRVCVQRSPDCVIPKTSKDQSSFFPRSKPFTSSSRSLKPRTWLRTGNNYPGSFSGSKPSLITSPPNKLIPQMKGNTQNTLYTRKGNSLVRKVIPVSASTSTSVANQSPSLGFDNFGKSIRSECMVNVPGQPGALKTGVNDVPLKGHIILPLPTDTKLESGSSPFTENLTLGCSEFAADPKNVGETNDAAKSYEELCKYSETYENQIGSDNRGAGQVEISSSIAKRIVYMKPKSNKLVASLDSTYSNGYYKKSKNQIIRTSFVSHISPTVTMQDSNVNSDGPSDSKEICSRFTKKWSQKVAGTLCKPLKAPLVGTLSSKNNTGSGHYRKILPHFFQWKRSTFRRRFVHNRDLSSNSTPSSANSKKLLLLRKRDAVYTRSTHGFSHWKPKVLHAGGSIKGSKFAGRHSEKVNEEALAVAVLERKTREQKDVACNSSQAKGLAAKEGSIQRRLVIGENVYFQIGKGNQLIRDPKNRTRILANEKVRWSLHTARQRLARKQKYCQFFTRFGKCNKDDGKCPYIHDPSKVVVCTKFLNGLCSNGNCKLTHKVIPERMPDCSYFLQGLCTNRSCPYRHVNVNPKASICGEFLRGYCADGNECRKKHSYVCPTFEAMGNCEEGTKCKLHHPKKLSKEKKRKRSRDENVGRRRYFGSVLTDIKETGLMVAQRQWQQSHDKDGDVADYIGFEVEESVDQPYEQATPCNNDIWDLQLDNLDEPIRPVLTLKNIFMAQSSSV
ncbi:Zinc finger CCCH domain-containing protein [Arachis hypogaea]|nr:Zinc finger CCCH domain-containing protein [Arachis hypogaea]